MFGFSFGEIFVISAVALLVLGPERIPQVARTVGRFIAELRRATDEVKREFNYQEFARNNPPVNLNLPISSGLRAEPLILDNLAQAPITETPGTQPESITNCEESEKIEITKN